MSGRGEWMLWWSMCWLYSTEEDEADNPRHTLYPYTNSWWNTSNIPGKKAENQSYIGGINNYEVGPGF